MRIPDEQLSTHFWLSEFVRSELADRLGLDNTPSEEQLANLRRNAAGMEQVRALLGVGFRISSGLRCEAVERELTKIDFPAWCRRHGKLISASSWNEYFSRKAHPTGLATDGAAPAYGPVLSVCQAVAESEIGFDQLIFEHSWMHVSWPRVGQEPRREVLTQMPGGAYARGIVDKATA